LDLILAVDDLKEFHTANLTKEFNREDYTYLARMTKGYPVYKFQNYGAKVHFNSKNIDSPLLKEISHEEQTTVQLRYGIVEHSDMLRDLNHWETLLSASFMQRPHTVLHECEEVALA